MSFPQPQLCKSEASQKHIPFRVTPSPNKRSHPRRLWTPNPSALSQQQSVWVHKNLTLGGGGLQVWWACLLLPFKGFTDPLSVSFSSCPSFPAPLSVFFLSLIRSIISLSLSLPVSISFLNCSCVFSWHWRQTKAHAGTRNNFEGGAWKGGGPVQTWFQRPLWGYSWCVSKICPSPFRDVSADAAETTPCLCAPYVALRPGCVIGCA